MSAPSALQARPQELAGWGIWEGTTRGGLQLQATLPVNFGLEAACAMMVSAGPKTAHGGVFVGPRLVLDFAQWVPAVTTTVGIVYEHKMRLGLAAQGELLRFLTPHSGITFRAGLLWITNVQVVSQFGLGYFWRV